jgi:aldose 1-epimerase
MKQYLLRNDHGDELTILSKGATLARWTCVLDGAVRDLLVHYPQHSGYLTDSCYLGAVVGPYANRIANSSFCLDRHSQVPQFVQLEANEGPHHLHGGRIGLHQLLWQAQPTGHDKLVLVTEVPDGQGGYPGPMMFRLTYQLSAPAAGLSELSVLIEASASQATLIGPTLHPYFNLSGDNTAVDAHLLQLSAAHYTAIDAACIPSGELCKVQDSVFDFRQSRPLGQIRLDHNFVVHGDLQQSAARLTSPDGQLMLEVCSDYPGLQVYSGDHLQHPFRPRQGICLEPQFFPDSPNQKGFPFHFTKPGQPFVAKIRYLLSKRSQSPE